MKFTWGHGILSFIILMMIGFITVFIKSFNQDHHLVANDYYAKEVQYQGQIDKMKNARDDKKIVKWSIENGLLVISINRAEGAKVDGIVSFLRMSDKADDVKMKLQLDSEGKQMIPAGKFKVGNYNFSVDWQEDEKKYFHKENIYIQ